MTTPFMFEKPLGLRDTLPAVQSILNKIKQECHTEVEKWGYDFMATPALEYDDTVGRVSAITNNQLFKLLDRQGHTVVLRPDMTAPIARVAASGLKEHPLPLRLAYTAALFRAQQNEGGRPSEFEQIGAELIGDVTPYGDAEMIGLMVKLLKLSGLENISIAVGHIGFVDALLKDVAPDQDCVNKLKNFLYEKNDVGFKEYTSSLKLSKDNRKRLLTFVESRRCDNQETLAAIQELLPQPYGQKVYQDATELLRLLKVYGVSDMIDLDVTLVSHLSYYTGFVFEGYGGNGGFAVCSGGRYDELLAKFDRPAPATGFGIRLDRLMEAVGFVSKESYSTKTAVIFSPEHYAEAYYTATKMRSEGEAVVLQEQTGIADLKTYTKGFDRVLFYTENSKS
ncbi:ATP phosphoribosyltransferase regulatory subunit [Scopulibacillus darangshiensis]|uniref:ATP phosphoribosyltransferase regulatory subunit n=1 Tax=Scopulibacillus darangshiensis TaxID=442528 RepID=A0A4R2NTJ9_9BACL|nr:ATP phosphoribosyltransferase regulatory subunit [Scopulibacillus darangshiensis]TCP24881.1 ATP phosphoribosyltransferase regulatory subunit [Scopulibacillus darangshiensis]